MRYVRLLLMAACIAVVLLTVMSWFSPKTVYVPWETPKEKFDPRLAQLQTVDGILAAARVGEHEGNELAQLAAVENVLRYRFYHGYNRYSFHENWVAWVLARVVHPDLDAKVGLNEILEQPWAACSQQAIVVQAILRRLNLPYAVVEYPGHFSAAARVNGDWYIVDPWGPLDRNRSRVWKYEDWATKSGRKAILGPGASEFGAKLNYEVPRLTRFNQFPAPRMAWFHPLTLFISKWGILGAILVLAFLFRGQALRAFRAIRTPLTLAAYRSA
jgi:hypothetical protein